MKKLITLLLFSCIASITIAQPAMNISSTQLNVGNDKPGDMYYRGTDNVLHRIPKGANLTMLSIDASGNYVWIAIPAAGTPGPQGIAGATGATGPIGATGAQGPAGTPGTVLPPLIDGDVLAVVGGVLKMVPASFNLNNFVFNNMTGTNTMPTLATKTGQYELKATNTPTSITAGGNVTVMYSWTDATGAPQSLTFPPMTTITASNYAPVNITAQAGSVILFTATATPGMTANVTGTVHQLN